LIGIISRANQAEVIAEFFELFKTPWELFRPGQHYDVVIATTDPAATVDARLLVVCSAAATDFDLRLGIAPASVCCSAEVQCDDISFPIYREALTFSEAGAGRPLMRAGGAIVGLMLDSGGQTVVRAGYDLFEEVRFLLSTGQPAQRAHVPTLDHHIELLRGWILSAGIPLLEVTAAPFGRSFMACLTHDIDFAGIRNHRLDHTMWGFVYRATAGAIVRAFRGRLSFPNLLRCWSSVAALPLVFAGWVKDFWNPFEWYLAVEEGLPATYFMIPFKRTAGQKVEDPHASRRAAAYDITDLLDWTKILMERNCEIGVHGIDAWHDADRGKQELDRIASVTGKSTAGVRMHWLLADGETPATLDRSGYAYDSTCGYNETVGYRAGTGQVFRPLGSQNLFELPLHIQDGALFFHNRLNLSEHQAEARCAPMLDHAGKSGGVLTLLWHDRSHAAERFWGDFYSKMVNSLRALNVWFGSGMQVVHWFAMRRRVGFELPEDARGLSAIRLRYKGEKIEPPLTVRIYFPGPRGEDVRACERLDVPFDGTEAALERVRDVVREMFAPRAPDHTVTSAGLAS
jgi:hypothetical protein